jgi:hypothetical protein
MGFVVGFAVDVDHGFDGFLFTNYSGMLGFGLFSGHFLGLHDVTFDKSAAVT